MRTRTRLRLCPHPHPHARTHAHSYMHMQSHVLMHLYTHICKHTKHAPIRTRAHMHTFTCTCKHTRTHTHTTHMNAHTPCCPALLLCQHCQTPGCFCSPPHPAQPHRTGGHQRSDPAPSCGDASLCVIPGQTSHSQPCWHRTLVAAPLPPAGKSHRRFGSKHCSKLVTWDCSASKLRQLMLCQVCMGFQSLLLPCNESARQQAPQVPWMETSPQTAGTLHYGG